MDQAGLVALFGRPLASARLNEVQRAPDQLQILVVFARIRPIDLDPLARARDASRLERTHVAPRELQLGRSRHREPESQPVAADAGEHLVADEVAVERVDLPGAHARNLQKKCIDEGFAV